MVIYIQTLTVSVSLSSHYLMHCRWRCNTNWVNRDHIPISQMGHWNINRVIELTTHRVWFHLWMWTVCEQNEKWILLETWNEITVSFIDLFEWDKATCMHTHTCTSNFVRTFSDTQIHNPSDMETQRILRLAFSNEESVSDSHNANITE